MKRVVAAVLLSFSFFVASEAIAYECTHYVSATAVQGQGDGSENDPWTLGEANSNVDAGDVVCLATGDYDTMIFPLDGGTSSSPIVYQPEDGAVPRINDVGDCIRIRYDWIVVRGILCEGDEPAGVGGAFPDETPANHVFSISRGVGITNANYAVIEDCTFRWIEGRGVQILGDGADSEYNVIRNNLFEFLGHPPRDVITVDGTLLGDEKNRPGDAIDLRAGTAYNLIEGNRIFKAGHLGIGVGRGTHSNVVRNNVIENPWWSTLTVARQDTNTGDEGRYNVISGNVVLETASLQEGLLSQTNGGSLILRAPDTTVRNNRFLRSELEGISGGASSGWPDKDGTRIYGNVIADAVEEGVRWYSATTSGAVDSSLFANNVITRNQTGNTSSDRQLLFELADAGSHANELHDNALRGNAILDSGGAAGSDVIEIEDATSGVDTLVEVRAISGLIDGDGSYDLVADNNESADGFLDGDRDNYYPAWDSPQRDAGVHLAWTESCSGSVITLEDDEDLGRVGDAVAFAGPIVTPSTEGSVELIPGDAIRIVGDPTIYEVTEVDHANDELTVDQAVSCAAGRGVSLAWQGAAPDVGFHEGFVARTEVESSETKDGFVIDGVIASYLEVTTADPTLWAGDVDYSGAKGVRAILSFDTSAIPSGVEILDATLELTRGLSAGSTVYADYGSLQLEIKEGGFGGDEALALGDYDAAADAPPLRLENQGDTLGDVWRIDVGRIGVGHPSEHGLDLINRSGATQFRLSFENETDGNTDQDQLGFISGKDTTGRAPLLLVTYEAPTETEDTVTSETGYIFPGVYTGAGLLNVGDSSSGDIVAIASFDTSSVPAGADVLGAELVLEIGAIYGDPIGELGDLLVEVKEGVFGASSAIAAEDATAAADETLTIPVQGDAVGDVWAITIPGDVINASGKTQIRLRFDGTDGSSFELLSFAAAAELIVHYDPDGI
ncbi:MAG: right-handed parallel beta-helix repeat-containing protein [Phycisphaerae bacterium]|nr:right-handed parallel beta-helix repeat-containing protein [Phycisphaerae bacterium]